MLQVGKPLALVAAAGCAAVALSACDSTLRIAPSFPPSTTTPPAAPTAEPPAPAAEPPARATSARWTAINWKTVAFEALGCPADARFPAEAKIDGPHYADLNGNGMSEAVVAASCPAATAGPVRVFVYEDAETRRPMKRLLTVGQDEGLRSAEVKMKGSTLTVTSDSGSERYTWNGTKFRRR
jgi:hypothetical protein